MTREFTLDVGGIAAHCYEAGTGFPVLLFHGSGFGVDTVSNFRNVIPGLSEHYRVLASDLIGFGKSGLKPAEPYFDMDLWVDQVIALIDHCDTSQVALVGHSLAGPIVLKAAARDPRVGAVFTTGTMGVPSSQISRGPLWRVPAGRPQVQAAVERSMFDPAEATSDEVDRRMSLLETPGYAEYFDSMFAGDPSRYIDDSAMTADELSAIQCPVVLFHGRHDRSFSADETSIPLGEALPRADVVLLARCAHSVAHERADIFMSTIRSTIGARS